MINDLGWSSAREQEWRQDPVWGSRSSEPTPALSETATGADTTRPPPRTRGFRVGFTVVCPTSFVG